MLMPSQEMFVTLEHRVLLEVGTYPLMLFRPCLARLCIPCATERGMLVST